MAKIAIVLNASWNVWNFRLTLLQALERAGHEISVIAPEDEYVERIPFPCYSIRIQSKSTNPVVDARTLFDLIRVFRKTRPDIVLLYTAKPNIYGNLAAVLTRVKTISNIAGLGTVFSRSGGVLAMVKWLYRIALRYPEKVFFQNREDMRMFIRQGLVTPQLAQYIPGSGVDLKRFSPQADRIIDKGRKFVFLLPARMLWDKGVSEYVAAANSILDEGYDAEFRLLGFMGVDNPRAICHAEMTELTQRHEINYIGVSDKIEDDIAAADCVVLPTYYPEGTPKALLEAASMAKPVITTDAVGCRDVVDDGINGLLCKPADAGDLHDKMKQMLQLPDEQRKKMGLNGRKKMQKEFDDEIVIRAYQSAIDAILGGK